MAVREVPARRQVHAQNGVARLEHRQVNARIGLASGVRLDVGVLGAKEFFGALDGQVFHDVHELAAAVVTFAGIAFAYLLVKTLPWASKTAGEVKFSEAIISSVLRWRDNSSFIARATSGSKAEMWGKSKFMAVRTASGAKRALYFSTLAGGIKPFLRVSARKPTRQERGYRPLPIRMPLNFSKLEAS